MQASPIQHEAALGYESARPQDIVASIPSVRDEVHASVIQALAGRRRTVPAVIDGRFGRIEGQEHVATVVVGLMDQMVVAAALMSALRESRCPMVAHLRTTIARAYANEVGAELARVRGE